MAQTATARRPKTRPKQQSKARAHGKFHWNELRTRNVERAKMLYQEAIGWGFERSSTPDGHDYWVANTPVT
jgi:predicted enzyme related to lactoylglutathione lyase